ncbi:MAG: hypothetical protein AB2814_08800 [Candidatus Sedimenticola endophacoides]
MSQNLSRGSDTLVTGVLWGWAGVLFFPEQQVHFQIFTVLVISGLAAGALTVHAPDFTSYLYYAIPSLLPVGGISLLQGDTLHVSIGVLVFAQMLFLLRTGHRLNESVLGSLRLRYENQGLVRDLQREKTGSTPGSRGYSTAAPARSICSMPRRSPAVWPTAGRWRIWVWRGMTADASP